MNHSKTRWPVAGQFWAWVDRQYVRTRKWQFISHAVRLRVVGVPLYVLHLDLDPSFVPLYVAKVRRGLEYLKAYDPRRYRRLRQDVDRIVVIHQAGPHYDHRIGAIVLRGKTFARKPIPEVALTLVHEATHARIQAWGIEYVPEIRGRIEHACIRQEIAFARRIPQGEKFAEGSRKALQQPWWTEERLHDKQLAEMEASRIPRWIARALLRLGSKRVP